MKRVLGFCLAVVMGSAPAAFGQTASVAVNPNTGEVVTPAALTLATAADLSVLTITSNRTAPGGTPLLKLESTDFGFTGDLLQVEGYDGDIWLRIDYHGSISANAGSAAAPGINFNTNGGSLDGNTGIYWVGENQLGIATDGVNRATFGNTALTLAENVAVAFSGTGADTTRTNLGAAASGANTDLTSITGLTGAVTTEGAFTANSANANGMIYIGGLPALPTVYAGEWFGANAAAPTVSNYTRLVGGGETLFNAPSGTVSFRVNNDPIVTASSTAFTVADTKGLAVGKTITAGGTTGARTINRVAGSVNFAAAATSLVVTNSLVTANSVILVTKGTNDSTARLGAAVAGAGSFTIHMDVAPAAECRVNFLVIN